MNQSLTFALLLTTLVLQQSYGQYEVQSLSEPRSEIASFSFDDQFFFVGGTGENFGSATLDIYHAGTNEWESKTIIGDGFSAKRQVQTGQFAVLWDLTDINLLDGNLLIYNHNTENWTRVLYERHVRISASISIVGHDEKIYITDEAGSTIIDVLDLNTMTWSEISSPVLRGNQSALVFDDKIFLMGGTPGTSQSSSGSPKVDVYSLATETWDTMNLSMLRSRAQTLVHNGLILVFGGNTTSFDESKVMDILDPSTLTLVDTLHLPNASQDYQAISMEDEVVFFDMDQNNGLVLDLESREITIRNFGYAFTQNAMHVGRFGQQAFFAGGHFDNSDLVHIYDADLKEWSLDTLPSKRNSITLQSNSDILMIAGGNTDGALFGNAPTGEVIIYGDLMSTNQTLYADSDLVTVYPNPTHQTIRVQSDVPFDQYQIYDAKGSLISDGTLRNHEIQLPSQVPKGHYHLTLMRGEKRVVKKFVVQ